MHGLSEIVYMNKEAAKKANEPYRRKRVLADQAEKAKQVVEENFTFNRRTGKTTAKKQPSIEAF